MKHIRFHALRHTSASILIAQGGADTIVALRLGHTNANTTRAIYAHAFNEKEAAAADLIATAIREAK
jgi:integrase